MRSEVRQSREYPYLVIRGGVPGMYGINRIEILQLAPETPQQSGVFTLVYAGESTDDQGRLTDGCRTALIEAVKGRVERTGHRICIVFADDDAVYVELNGSMIRSATRPGRRGRGTLRLQEENTVVAESLLVH